MFAAWDFYDGPIHPAVHSALHILYGAAGQRKYLRPQLAPRDLAYGLFVFLRNGGSPGLDPMHTQFRKRLRNPQLVVLAEQNSCLLLTIA